MDYKVVALNQDGTLDGIVETMTEEKYEEVMSNIQKLQTSMLSKDYHTVVKDNVRDLLDFLPTVDMKSEHAFATINRYTYNVLGAFYAWIEYYESNFKSIFASVKKDYFDRNFAYRMTYNLRTYMTHCEMAITQVQIDFDKREMFIYIEPSRLLEHSDRLQKYLFQNCEKCAKKIRKLICMT